jgi:propanediol dehydratase small subunit
MCYPHLGCRGTRRAVARGVLGQWPERYEMGILGVGLLILLFVVRLTLCSSLPKRYRSRKCEGPQWRKAFPQAKKDEIREFLLLFTSAFAFKDSEKLQFSPNDRIWEIYRDLYPNRWLADALELETLTDELNTKLGIALDDVWSETLTLGEVFGLVQGFALEHARPSASGENGEPWRFAPVGLKRTSLLIYRLGATQWSRIPKTRPQKGNVCPSSGIFSQRPE